MRVRDQRLVIECISRSLPRPQILLSWTLYDSVARLKRENIVQGVFDVKEMFKVVKSWTFVLFEAPLFCQALDKASAKESIISRDKSRQNSRDASPESARCRTLAEDEVKSAKDKPQH